MPPIVVSGKEIKFERGYQSIDLMAGDRRFRFINTHLEAFSSDVAHAQAKQLLQRTRCLQGPDDHRLRLQLRPGERHRQAGRHQAALGALPAHHAWIPRHLAALGPPGGGLPEEGFTSGLSETVDDDTAAGFDHRIDMVFARSGKGGELPVLRGDVTGDEVTDRNVDGLWPSDHAGVVMKLRLR